MRKLVNKFIVLFTAIFMFSGIVSQPVRAQETSNAELFQQIEEANANIESFSGDLSLTLVITDLLDGVLEGDLKFNTEPLEFDIDGGVNANIVTETAEGETSTMPLSFSGQIILKDSILYLNDGYAWSQMDASDLIAEMETTVDQAMTAEAQNLSAEFQEKYYQIEETDTEYIMTMADDFDPDAFYEDLMNEIDFEAGYEEAHQEALEQLEAQAEAEGETLTEEDYEEFDRIFRSSFEGGIKIGANAIQDMEVRYNKETLLMTSMTMNIVITEEDLATFATDMGEEDAMAELQGFDMNMTIVLNVDEMNSAVEIVAPEIEGAESMEGTESMEDIESTGDLESVEESSEE